MEHEKGVRHLLYVVVRESAITLKLLASEDQVLLVRGDALLVLNLGLDKDLHSTTEAEHGMGVGHLLYVVVRESATILELPASKDQVLLVRGDALLVLNLGLDEDLHPTMEMEHEMGVGEGVTILGLPSLS